MSAQLVAPAKITQPHPRGIYLRTRLFRILEEATDSSCIWICGPPGAGKTTLAASYCDHKENTSLWYQVDEGDTDVANLFYYLNQAAKKVTRRRKDLPLFTSAFASGLTTFGRRYFEKLYSWLKPPFVLVLDNYQLVGPSASMHDVIVTALETLPAGGQVMVLSREEPPGAFARLRANRMIHVLDWSDLCLDPTEIGEIAKLLSNDQLSTQELEDLEKRSDGWVAGLILMLQDEVQAMTRDPRVRDEHSQVMFDYFAHEIFRRQPEDVRTILMQAALLPRMNVKLVQDLTGHTNAGRILSELHQRNYFVQRHGLSKSSYQFHPLFREFLQAQLHKENDPTELQRLRIRAAQLLELAAQPEAAIDLYIGASEYANAGRLICELASVLLAQGRNETVRNWITQLPKSSIDVSPWLPYWLGCCEILIDPTAARRNFEDAYRRFKATSDIPGICLSWSSAIDASSTQLAEWPTLDEWIVEGEQLVESYSDFPSMDIESRVVASMCFVLTYARPDHPMLPTYVERARELLSVGSDTAHGLTIGSRLLAYYIWNGSTTEIRLLVQDFEKVGTGSDVDVARRTLGYAYDSICSSMTGNQEDALQTVEKGLALCDASGVDVTKKILLFHGAWAALCCGERSLAGKYLESVGSQAATRNLGPIYYFIQAWLDWSSGQTLTALEKLRSSLRDIKKSGYVFGTAMIQCCLSILEFELGESRQGRANLDEAMRVADSAHSPWLKFNCCFIDASDQLKQGREVACLDALRQGFAAGREMERYTGLWWDPVRMSRLCAKALGHDIEVDYVQEVIRRNGLVPELSAGALKNWPWPIRIYVLGEFRLMIDGRLEGSDSKRQKKVIELLKVLVVLGGRDVDATRLTDILWPDSEGDDANNALKTAVHRLRGLLGKPDTIEVSAGHVSLNLQYCWTDLGSFERLIREARNDAEKPALLEQAINLYGGPLLRSEEEASWVVGHRERVRSEFSSAVTMLGQLLESKQQLTKAIDTYERALEVDYLIESFYLRLMHCHRDLDHRAEALSTYERCTRTLAAELGIEPSRELQTFGSALRNP